MPIFPNIKQPVYPFKPKWEDPSLQSQMENGIVVSRAKFTRSRETFTLQWTALSTAHYVQLRNFYKTVVMGGSLSFEWTYPPIPDDSYAGQTFTVRFVSGDVDSFSLDSPAGWSGQLVIQEE